MEKDLDTIIVSSRPGGIEFFITKGYWENIRISDNKIKNIKYIALYQAITEKKINKLGKINKIEKYVVSPYKPPKYRIFFTLLDIEVNVILDDTKNRKLVIQSPRYTNFDHLLKCKTLSELFK